MFYPVWRINLQNEEENIPKIRACKFTVFRPIVCICVRVTIDTMLNFDGNFKDWDDVAFNFNGHMNFQAFIVILPKQINEFLFFSIYNFFFIMTLMNGNIFVRIDERGHWNPQHRLFESRISQCKTRAVDVQNLLSRSIFSFKQKTANWDKMKCIPFPLLSSSDTYFSFGHLNEDVVPAQGEWIIEVVLYNIDVTAMCWVKKNVNSHASLTICCTVKCGLLQYILVVIVPWNI